MSGDIKEPPSKKAHLNQPDRYANKWLDENMPAHGFACMDFDLLPRWYRYGTDPFGEFMLIEVKSGNSLMSKNQFMDYKELDRMLRAGDTVINGSRQRYLGFYLLWSELPTWYVMHAAQNRFSINLVEVNYAQFTAFLQRELYSKPTIKPFEFTESYEQYYERSAKLRSG